MTQTTTHVNACDASIWLDNAQGVLTDISGSSNRISMAFTRSIGVLKTESQDWPNRIGDEMDLRISLRAVYTTASDEAYDIIKNWYHAANPGSRTLWVYIPSIAASGGDRYYGEVTIQNCRISAAPTESGPIAVECVLLSDETWARSTNYVGRVLGYGPIAYWPLWETVGATAECQVNSAQDGTYTGATLNNTTGPDGSPAPYFDGNNDYVDVQTATLAAAFDGLLGSWAIWCKVVNVGAWTDAANRNAGHFLADGNNFVQLYKNAANNWWSYNYRGGGANTIVAHAPYSETAWFHIAITWSDTADELICYIDGAQTGGIQTMGTWVNALTLSVIGAVSLVPAQVWHGWLAHTALWDRVLLPAEVAALATV